jgi:hypothetical protein
VTAIPAGAIKIGSIDGTLTVTFTTSSGGTPVAYSNATLTSTVSLPATVADGTATTFYFASRDTLTLSVQDDDGNELAADGNATRTVTLSSPGVVASFSFDTTLPYRGDSGHTAAAAAASSGGSSPVAWHGPYTVTAETVDETPVGYTPPTGSQILGWQVFTREVFDGSMYAYISEDAYVEVDTLPLGWSPPFGYSAGGAEWAHGDSAPPVNVLDDSTPMIWTPDGASAPTTGDADLYLLVADPPT